jgi:beta-lactamase regulating signal transducer with metallopeptidase domain
MMERAIVDYLANAIWQVPLLVAAASLLLWTIGAGARIRHLVWLAVLLLALLLPLRGTGSGDGHPSVHVLPPLMVMATEPSMMPETAAPPALEAERVPGLPPLPALRVSEGAARWLVRLFLAAAGIGLWRITSAWIAAGALLRRSRPLLLTPRSRAIFVEMAARQGVPMPQLRQSDEAVSPLVIGAFDPVLLLPASFLQLKDDEVIAAISHELAHLARRDYLVNLLCQFATLPLVWHPAIHLVLRRIRDTREMICDEVAAAEMQSPVRYATCLVAFALRALDGGAPRRATQAVSMFDNRILEERINRLTQKTPAAPPRHRALRLLGGGSGMLLAVTAALMFHVTPIFAEPPTAVEPPVPPAPVAPAVSAEMKKSIDAEARERAREQRRVADQFKEKAKQQQARDERQREAEEEAREAAREAAQEARERALEAAQEARDHAREMQQYNAEMKRTMDQALRISQEALKSVDMGKINREIAQSTAIVQSPEFRQQMAQLRDNMQEFHQSMAELHKQMDELREQMRSMQAEVTK